MYVYLTFLVMKVYFKYQEYQDLFTYGFRCVFILPLSTCITVYVEYE